MRTRTTLPVFVALAAAAGCGGSSGGSSGPGASIQITPTLVNQPTVQVTSNLTATVREGAATINNPAVVWSSNDPNTVQVVGSNGTAQVTGISEGATQITGTYNGASASVTVNVNPAVAAGTFQVASLVVGERYSCALIADGTPYCWGFNATGQLGINLVVDRTIPTAVLTNLKFTQLAPGANHTCGIAMSGDTYCWGYNFYGELGDGTTTQRLTPVLVLGGHQFTQLAAGVVGTCALNGAGELYCWGGVNNPDDVFGESTVPVRVASPMVFSQIFLGRSTGHICGLNAGGTAFCWGANAGGQVGNGVANATFVAVPTQVQGGQTYTRLALGDQHTCGLATGGQAYCWGSGNALGVGETGTTRLTPTAVGGGHTFTSLVSGANHVCGLTSAGIAWCWGNNTGGLGSGTINGVNTPNPRASPIRVSGGLTFSQLSAGVQHTCGRSTTGWSYCWGATSGSIGDATGANRSFPTASVTPDFVPPLVH